MGGSHKYNESELEWSASTENKIKIEKLILYLFIFLISFFYWLSGN